jgi:hypothetical protein
MKNEMVKSLVVNSKNPVKELSLNKYNSPFIVEGGALFNNGLKVGFCTDKEPCNGTLSSNTNKLLFFTNNFWHSIQINGLREYKTFDLVEPKYTLNFNTHCLYYISIVNNIDFNLEFIINDFVLHNYIQEIELIFNNFKNNYDITINLETKCPIIENNNLIHSIKINNTSIRILNLKILDDIILVV